MSGHVTFRLGRREYAVPLTDVREVVRLRGLHDLPAMTPPLAGVLDLRGAALPVLDLRPPAGDAGAVRRGDVLVLTGGSAVGPAQDAAPQDDARPDDGAVGIAVDEVRAVTGEGELRPAGASGADGVLPAYVREVLRGPHGVVFLVDLAAMVDGVRGVGASPASAGS